MGINSIKLDRERVRMRLAMAICLAAHHSGDLTTPCVCIQADYKRRGGRVSVASPRPSAGLKRRTKEARKVALIDMHTQRLPSKPKTGPKSAQCR